MSETATEPKQHTPRKVRALLAGGLVLGVGAAITLAAWTDQEWAEGIFSTGSFNIQSSADGVSFDDHEAEGDAVTLSFDLTGADNMAPEDVVAAPFVLRLNEETTYDAEVELNNATLGPDANANADNLTYGIVQVDDAAACTPDATGTEIAASNTPLGTVGTTNEFTLTAGAGDQAGSPVTLCFQVTAGEGLDEGATTEAHWEFVGTSVE